MVYDDDDDDDDDEMNIREENRGEGGRGGTYRT